VHVVGNLLAHPGEEKYSSLNYAKINKRLADTPEALSLLTTLIGFEVKDDRYVLGQASGDLRQIAAELQRWLSQSNNAPATTNTSSPSPSSSSFKATKPSVPSSSSAAAAAASTSTRTFSTKKKNPRREAMRRQFEQQRKEANEKIVGSSKANEVAFGMKIGKVQWTRDDPPPKKKG
jgi:hypothetical protein